MGIFNEQSFDHPFAKGIQGAPGVGFNLTSSGDYDMNKKGSQMLVTEQIQVTLLHANNWIALELVI